MASQQEIKLESSEYDVWLVKGCRKFTAAPRARINVWIAAAVIPHSKLTRHNSTSYQFIRLDLSGLDFSSELSLLSAYPSHPLLLPELETT